MHWLVRDDGRLDVDWSFRYTAMVYYDLRYIREVVHNDSKLSFVFPDAVRTESKPAVGQCDVSKLLTTTATSLTYSQV